MIREYLNFLKNQGNFSWSDLSKMSGIPDATIRKIFSGETADPRFETVVKLVTAMGGSLDKIIDKNIEEDTEMNSIIAIKEIYEARISDLKDSLNSHISYLKKDKKILAIALGILMGFLLIFLCVDLFIGSVGWIKY